MKTLIAGLPVRRHQNWQIWSALLGVMLLSACASTPSGTTPNPAPVATVAVPDATAKLILPAPEPEPRANGEAIQPVDPLRPGVDIQTDVNTRADLWSRVRSGFAMPDLDNSLVRGREQWYATRPDYVDRMTQRGGRYLFHIVEEVERRNMPTELALLPFIESAFNPEALSTAKASGMWQFMPATGKDYALRQNIFRDDRRDVLASTRAALDYLQRLHGMFGDWHLALAAYNWGEGSVQRAIKRNRLAGLPTNYSSLRMPNETQYYVPKLQAVKNIIANPQAFGIRLPDLQNHPYFLSVPIDRDMDVEVAARLANIPVNEFKNLNPQMNKPVILAAGVPQILLPYDNAKLFASNVSSHRGPLASWTAWVVPTTIRPSEAAKKWGMEEAALREINRIPPHMLIKSGSTLLVPRHPQSPMDVTSHVADHATVAFAPEGLPPKRTVFRAKPKDTVAVVAQRYRVSAQQVAEWNNLSESSVLKTGQSLVVYVPQSRAVSRPRSSSRAVAQRGPVRRQQARAAAASTRQVRGTSPSANRARVNVAATGR
ncbi:MAG: transglycosylase SLT domain-containing protein [Pseudomonadota bacterium]